MKIKIFPDADAVAQKAAEIIAAEARGSGGGRGPPSAPLHPRREIF